MTVLLLVLLVDCRVYRLLFAVWFVYASCHLIRGSFWEFGFLCVVFAVV